MLSSLERRSPIWDTDPDAGRYALSAALSLVLRLLDRDPDPAKSREHVLVSLLAARRLESGQSGSENQPAPYRCSEPTERAVQHSYPGSWRRDVTIACASSGSSIRTRRCGSARSGLISGNHRNPCPKCDCRDHDVGHANGPPFADEVAVDATSQAGCGIIERKHLGEVRSGLELCKPILSAHASQAVDDFGNGNRRGR